MPSKLDLILKAIDKPVTDAKIRVPCKHAEMTYRPKYPVPKNLAQFYFVIGWFWIHLNRSYNIGYRPKSFHFALAEAVRAIENKYRDEGGLRTAFEDAKTQTISRTISLLTDMFIYDKTNQYVSIVLQAYINPYSYEDRKNLISDYVKKFKIRHTEGELQDWVANYESIIRSHVRWHDELRLDRNGRAFQR